MVLATAGVTRAVALSSVAAADVDVTVDLSLDKAPTGSGTQLALVARKVGTSEYRMRVHQRTTSRNLQLLRVANGAESQIGAVNLPGGAYTAGQVLHLRFQVVGTGSTALAGKAWFDGAAEPAGWQIQAADSTAQLQGPGAVGLTRTSRAPPRTRRSPSASTTSEPSRRAPGRRPTSRPPRRSPRRRRG